MLTVYRKCGVGVVLTFLTAGLGIAADAAAQEQEKATSRAHDAGWKANVITALFPEKVKRKLRVKIETDQLVCRSGGSDVLEIPLQAVTGITRDRAKDYPATEFLLGVAMMPTGEQHTFASKEYRHQMAARGTLAVISLVGLLFPKHKEVVLVSWRDQFGEHDAEFRMSRADGQKMLYELEQESGLQARDLEKEGKDIEKGRKELQRWMRGKLQQHGASRSLTGARKADPVGEKSQSTVNNQANGAADAGDLGAERSEMTSQSVNPGPDIPTSIEKIFTAKNVFLAIAGPSTGDASSLFGALSEDHLSAFDELAKAIRKWNRLTIVSDVSKSDLVLIVVEWEDFHSWGKTVACRDWLLVFDGSSMPTPKSQPLWKGDREQWGKWGGCSGAGRTVIELRKLIEREERSHRKGP